MTINENGERKRISKHEVVVKQLMKQTMTGSTQAQRIYFVLHQQAHEGAALVAAPQPNNSGKYDVANNLSDEELTGILVASREETE